MGIGGVVFAQGFVETQLDAVRVVDEPIRDGVGGAAAAKVGMPDHPHGELRGDQRSAAVGTATRRNPSLSELARLGLWRVCGESGTTAATHAGAARGTLSGGLRLVSARDGGAARLARVPACELGGRRCMQPLPEVTLPKVESRHR